ncbi:2174_t:CDS:2, partial [Diversispora eburnea]
SLATKFEPSQLNTRHKVRLYEVLHGFAYLTQFWKKYIDSDMANRILTFWTGCDPQYILVEFDDFSQGKNYPFDNETIYQFENNIYKYWCWIKDAYLEIGTVTSRIFGICVNAASVERL